MKTTAALRCRSRGANVRFLQPSVPISEAGADSGEVFDPIEVDTSVSIAATNEQVDTGLDTSRQWIGVFGNVTPGKGVGLLLEALELLDVSRLGLLIAGRFDPVVADETGPSLERLRRKGLLVELRNDYLTNAEFDALIVGVDIIPLTYDRDGPSGIFGKAIALGVPVVVAGLPQLAAHATRHGLAAATTRRPHDIAGAIRRALAIPVMRKPCEMSGSKEFYAALCPE